VCTWSARDVCVYLLMIMCKLTGNRMDHMVYRESCEVCMEYASRDRLGLRLPVLSRAGRGARPPTRRRAAGCVRV
jgi:hypothetical protein